jgi:hypothetical protein
MKTFYGILVLVGVAGLTSWAQLPAAAPSTNAPPAVAGTNAPADTQMTADVSAFVPEWVGFVRVLKGDKGEVRAVRLVAGDKLIAVELNEKGAELAKVPRTRKVLVKGSMEDRDGRACLVVTDFKDAPEGLVPGVAIQPDPVAPASAVEAPSTNSAPASTNAAPVSTNAAPVPVKP